MTSAEPSQPSTSRPRRRTLIVAAVVGLVILGAIGLGLAWLFFFGTDAPTAPTLDNALQVLQPSASPAG